MTMIFFASFRTITVYIDVLRHHLRRSYCSSIFGIDVHAWRIRGL